MPVKYRWTATQDDTIRDLRARSFSWDSVAAALTISRSAAQERGRAIGARLPARSVHDAEAEAFADPTRAPLPPGHKIAWDILTAGTVLAGTLYPWPPLVILRDEAA